MKHWDVFISHASEDTESVALPLTKVLKDAGLRVWLDRQELRVGDSLRQKIDEGLAQSSFGVVILSQNFLTKDWPKQELDGLFSREEEGRKVILPVWHEIDKKLLNQYSPMLSSRVAANTSNGLTQVASELIGAIFHPGSNIAPSLAKRLIDLVESDAQTTNINAFLAAHPDIVTRAFGFYSDAPVFWSPIFPNFSPDFCVGLEQLSIRRMDWRIVILESASNRLFESSMTPTASLAGDISKLEKLRAWILANLESARKVLPDIQPDFQGVVVAGRRGRLTLSETEHLREYNDYLFGARVRTYDWLIDAAVSLQ